jgi:hypothetical protein
MAIFTMAEIIPTTEGRIFKEAQAEHSRTRTSYVHSTINAENHLATGKALRSAETLAVRVVFGSEVPSSDEL